MGIYVISYVTFVFKNNKGKEIEKIKTYLVEGEDKAEAERNFLNKNLKFKKIKSIKEDTSNTLGNMCPDLLNFRNQLLK